MAEERQSSDVLVFHDVSVNTTASAGPPCARRTEVVSQKPSLVGYLPAWRRRVGGATSPSAQACGGSSWASPSRQFGVCNPAENTDAVQLPVLEALDRLGGFVPSPKGLPSAWSRRAFKRHRRDGSASRSDVSSTEPQRVTGRNHWRNLRLIAGDWPG
jgi:hypothetical protein